MAETQACYEGSLQAHAGRAAGVPLGEISHANAMRSYSCADLVSELNRTIDTVLGPLLPIGVPCALLDFPNHGNLGDSAIWLGTIAWLKRHHIPLAYVCERRTYSRARLARRIGERGVILLNGGGNLGDLYRGTQAFREQVIQEFPNHTIIQLPQSMEFQTPEALQRAQVVFNRHRQLTLLLRSAHSLALARKAFAVPSLLCPDMAFALGSLPRRTPMQDVLVLLRQDRESVLQDAARCANWEDWPQVNGFAARLCSFLADQQGLHPRKLSWLSAFVPLLFDVAAHQRLAAGCALLRRACVVVTDRLHGHILCVLLNIPHVVLDNSYGKTRAVHETWTSACRLVRWATSIPEAMQRVSELLAHRSTP